MTTMALTAESLNGLESAFAKTTLNGQPSSQPSSQSVSQSFSDGTAMTSPTLIQTARSPCPTQTATATETAAAPFSVRSNGSNFSNGSDVTSPPKTAQRIGQRHAPLSRASTDMSHVTSPVSAKVGVRLREGRGGGKGVARYF